jgi:hypothetical protein
LETGAWREVDGGVWVAVGVLEGDHGFEDVFIYGFGETGRL